MKLTALKTLITACVVGSTMMLSAHANNPAPTIKADAPNRYEVKKGDTLWDISGRYLNNPSRWREIWATNKQVKNPHLIYPGDILIMCIIKGQTLVGVDTGEGCAGIEKRMQEPARGEPVEVKSSEGSVSTIPLSNIRYWLDRSVIVNPDDFETTPYVLASKKGNLITGAGDNIYVRGASLTPGQTYGVYRKSDPYVDTRTGAVIGLEATQVARGIVTDVSGNGVSTIRITQSFESAIHEGDRVFSEIPANLPVVFYPAPAEITRGGSIARVMGATIGSAAKGSVVAVNIGASQGAKAGHVLDVYRKGALVRDTHDNNTPVRLPSEKAGQVMVFKVFDQISYAYVLSAELPLSKGDQLVPPEYF